MSCPASAGHLLFMKTLKLIASFIIVILTACHPRPDRATLRTVMPLLERSEKVDSCLTVLKSIDTTALTRPADKARWSLLYAMALDKNYIDTTDLSVLQPAIDRYTHWTHINRLDKFYTWYYKGRIEENEKIYDASLDSYLHAERYIGAMNDVYRTRLYFGFFRDYSKTISNKKAYEASCRALFFSRKSDDKELYSEALLTNACAAADIFYHNEADKSLSEYEKNCLNVENQAYRVRYYKAKMICYGLRTGSLRDSSEYYLNKYISYGGADVDALTCLMNCILREDMKRGKEIMVDYNIENPGDGIPASGFFHFRSKVRESEGDLRGAVEDMRIGDRYLNEEYRYNVYNETAYVADRYHGELKRIRMVLWLSLLCFIIVVMLFVWILVSNNRKQQYNVLRQGYDSIYNEYQIIGRYLSKGKAWGYSQPDDISYVKERIERIGEYFLKTDETGICEISKKYVEVIGRKDYYSMINLLMALYCHNCHKELRQRGMNDGQMAICALMIMGCSTKEIEFILERKNIRNDCVEIRQKLGVEEGYLDDFMRKFYEEITIHDTDIVLK